MRGSRKWAPNEGSKLSPLADCNVSDVNQGQRRNSWPMHADSTHKLEPVMKVLRCVFRRQSLAASVPFGEPSKSPEQTLTQNETVFIIKDHTHKNPRLSLLKMVFQFLLKCSTPPLPIHAHTHNSPLSLSQPPGLTLTLQQHQDIVLLDGSLHHQRRSRNTAGAV